MASVVVRRSVSAPIGAAASEAASIVSELFPGVLLADVQMLHINRKDSGVEVTIVHEEEMSLADAKSALEAGEDLRVVEFIP